MHKNSPFWNKNAKNFLGRGTPPPQTSPPRTFAPTALKLNVTPQKNILVTALHACIHAPMVRLQPKPKIVRSANGSMEYGKPTVDLQVALSASSKNTRCATSDVNPFKTGCNLQITKATVNETQWWQVITDVTNDVKLTSAIGVVLK